MCGYVIVSLNELSLVNVLSVRVWVHACVCMCVRVTKVALGFVDFTNLSINCYVC